MTTDRTRRDPLFVKGRDGLSPAQRIVILERTLAWLEANPHRAITGALAIDKFGAATRPKWGECFCFLGRLCVEAEIDLELSPRGDAFIIDPLEQWLEPLGVCTEQFVAANDGSRNRQKRFDELNYLIEMTSVGMPK